MSRIATARCHASPSGTPGCENFGNPAAGGRCNSCASGGQPCLPPAAEGKGGESGVGRTVGAAGGSTAVNLAAGPDNAEEVAGKLARSLAAAKCFADDAVDYPRGSFVPFGLQRKVQADQQIFVLQGGGGEGEGVVYVGSEYAAADIGLLRGVGVSRVINISSGSRTVPNYGESVEAWKDDVEYVHFPLEDRIGFAVQEVEAAFVKAVDLLRVWVSEEGRSVLVHCSAGLSRSASMCMAFMMCGGGGGEGCSLADAVAAFTVCRGRQPACTPTYWTALMRLERRLGKSGPGDAPSFDYTPWICDDVGGKGEAGRATGLQLETDEVVATLLHDEQHDWDADAVVRTLLP